MADVKSIEGTPLSRLEAAVEEHRRAREWHATKKADAETARKRADDLSTQEAHAAKSVEATRLAVQKAAADVVRGT